MPRILELRYEVLVDEAEDYFLVRDKGFEALNKIPEIIEVDTSDVEDIGFYDDYYFQKEQDE